VVIDGRGNELDYNADLLFARRGPERLASPTIGETGAPDLETGQGFRGRGRVLRVAGCVTGIADRWRVGAPCPGQPELPEKQTFYL